MTVHKELEAGQPLARSSRIATRHLARLAMVYVRQSTQRQVLECTESQRRQHRGQRTGEILLINRVWK